MHTFNEWASFCLMGNTTDIILARPTLVGSPLIQEPIPPLPPCQGTAIRWDLGSLYQTYPFSIHDPTSRFKPGYTLLFVDPTAKLPFHLSLPNLPIYQSLRFYTRSIILALMTQPIPFIDKLTCFLLLKMLSN